MSEAITPKLRMPLWKWSLRSAAWAVPVGIVFAPLIGFIVSLTWIIFCLDTLGPDPVEHPIPQWRKDLGDIVLAPGMAVAKCFPRDAFAGAGRLIQRGIEYLVFGLPYSWFFFFLLFTALGFTKWNRVISIAPPTPSG